MSSSAQEFHLTVEHPNGHAADLLSSASGQSKAFIKQAMQKGAVWLTRKNSTQRLRRSKKTLHAEDQLHFYYDQRILKETAKPPRLIADHTGYSIWYKPYGVYSQGSKWGDHCTINRLVEQQLERPSLIVHRLDRATTGLMIIAHEKKLAAAFSAMFKQRSIEKHYLAIVHGEHPAKSVAQTVDSDIDGRKAISHVRNLQYDGDLNQSLLDVHIETGRKHQIRRHLSETGFPIIGDRLYGSQQAHDEPDLKLCCHDLRFRCPLTEQLKHFQLPPGLQPNFRTQSAGATAD